MYGTLPYFVGKALSEFPQIAFFNSLFGVIVKALKARRDAGIDPFTVLSCDNLPGNGNITRQTVLGLARLGDPELADWIAASVSFPNNMVDRIVPAAHVVGIPAIGSLLGQEQNRRRGPWWRDSS